MKLSTIFWGVFFILLGGLFLLNNLNILDVDWGTVWRLWPVILVVWGLSIMFGKEPIRWYVVLLLIFLIVFMVGGTVFYDWFESRNAFTFGDANYQQFSEPYDSSIERATFELEGGAGKFIIEGTTDRFVEATTQLSFGRYDLDRIQLGNEERVRLKMSGRARHWNFGRWRNRAEIKLHPDPVWDIDIEAGAASVDFDLTPFKAREVKIDGGAASFNVQLGDRVDEAHVDIHTGASSVRIEVPRSVGCEVRTNTVLSSRAMSDFEKVGSKTYQTEHFDEAAKKIYIEISAGVSSVRVERY